MYLSEEDVERFSHGGNPTAQDAADAMIWAVEEYGGGITFVELVKICEMIGYPARGDLALCLPGHPTIIMWAGVNEAFADALDLFRDSERVEPRNASPLTYFIDGGMLRLPVAKRPPKGGYKKDHWLPMVFWSKADIARFNPRG